MFQRVKWAMESCGEQQMKLPLLTPPRFTLCCATQIPTGAGDPCTRGYLPTLTVFFFKEKTNFFFSTVIAVIHQVLFGISFLFSRFFFVVVVVLVWSLWNGLELILATWLFLEQSGGGSGGKASAWQCGTPGFVSWVGKIPWRRKWQATPALLPGKSHGPRSRTWLSDFTSLA